MATTFHLQIVTPDGGIFDGQAVKVLCRAMDGDICILANHADLCIPLGMGEAKVELEDGTVRYAACIGGMLTVFDHQCRLVATTWEWSDQIDLDRAKAAQQRAREKLQQHDLDKRELSLAEAKLKRALIRTSVASR